MHPDRRARFDELLDEALARLPQHIHDAIEEIPVIVDDRPDPELARQLYHELGASEDESLEEFARGLCGLHSGHSLLERSVERDLDLPPEIRLFREGIIEMAGGWDSDRDEDAGVREQEISEQILITLLHEIGHHFGLEEDDLESLGYG